MKRRGQRFAILLVWAITWPNFSLVFAASEKYSLQDLEILSEQKSYWEFLKHAHDVRPGQRNKHWVELVQGMAIGFIEFHLRSQNFTLDSYTLLRKIAHWPALRDDEFFQVKYGNYMTHYVRHCLKSEKFQDCAKRAERFWRTSAQDPEIGFQFSLAIHNLSPSYPVWNFLKDVVRHPVSSFYCKRPLVAGQLHQKLLSDFSPFIKPGKTKSSLSDVQIRQRLADFMHEKCWQAFLPQLKQALFAEIPRRQMVLHKILNVRKALNSAESDFFYTLYLLRGPLVGETFNQSWNVLARIGQNFERKAVLLKALQKQDPLEGKIFASPNHHLKKTVVGHLAKHLPEYLNLYAKTCLEYREGKKTFPHGNPTVECPEFFKISRGTSWVSQKLHLRFSGTQKL